METIEAERDATRRRASLAWAGLVLVLVAAHVRVATGGLSYEGPLLLVDHVYDAALALAMLVVFACVGGALLRTWGVRDVECVDRVLLSLLTGAGVLATVLLVLGLLGGLSPPVVSAIPLVAAGFGWREVRELPERLGAALDAVPRSVLVTAGVVGAVLLLRGVAPPTDWDTLMYHLHLPDLFLDEGRVFVPRDTLHVAFVGLVHMLYLPPLALGSASAPALLSLAFGVLLALAVYRLAQRTVGSAAAEMAGVAIWGTTTIALVSVTARVDVTLLLFLTVGHAALYEALEGDGGRPWLLLAGLLAGFSVGVKYQAGAYVLAVIPLVAWAVVRARPGTGPDWRDVAVMGVVAAITALPWFAKNLLLLDAPLYPFLAQRLLPPWLAELHGSRIVPQAVDTAVFGALSEVRQPFNLVDAFFRPERLSVEGEAVYYHLSPLLLLIPTWLLWFRDRNVAWLVVPGLGYAVLLLVVSTRTNLRYLLPAVPPLTVAASAFAVRIVRFADRRISRSSGATECAGDGRAAPGAASRSRVRRWAMGVAAVSLLPAALSLYAWLPSELSIDHVVGAESRSTYLSERRNPALVIQAGLTGFGDHPPPDDFRVLMLFEAREFYAPRAVLQDPVLTNWALLAPIVSGGACDETAPVTHVLVGTGVLEYYFRRGLDPGTIRWPAFRSYARRCLERVLEVPGYRFYRVTPSAGGPGPG